MRHSTVKLRNRRVTLYRNLSGMWHLRLKRLRVAGELRPTCVTTETHREGKNMTTTYISFSDEAMAAIIALAGALE